MMKKICVSVFFVLGMSLMFVATGFGEEASAEKPKIDLAEKPWLVESANIPPEMLAQPKSRILYAEESFRFRTIQEILDGTIEVERWVNEPPKDLTGKFVLIEVWATWCPPCRRSLALLEYYHKKYKDDLVVISICETDEDALKKMESPKLGDLSAPLAVDTHRRFANRLKVYGVPHAVLIEPVQGAILWEGMPTQIGYELADPWLGKVLANRKKLIDAGKMPEKAALEIKACPLDPDKPNEKPKAPIRCAGEDGTPCGQETE